MKNLCLLIFLLVSFSCDKNRVNQDGQILESRRLSIVFLNNKQYRVDLPSEKIWVHRPSILALIDFNIEDGFLDLKELTDKLAAIRYEDFTRGDVNMDFVGGFVSKSGPDQNEVLVGIVVDAETFSYLMKKADRSTVRLFTPSKYHNTNYHADSVNESNPSIPIDLHYEYLYFDFPQNKFVFLLNPYSGIRLKNLDALD